MIVTMSPTERRDPPASLAPPLVEIGAPPGREWRQGGRCALGAPRSAGTLAGPVRLIRPTSCDKPWDKPAQIGRESGGIGRRGRLKICCPSKTWGFEAPLSHHACSVS